MRSIISVRIKQEYNLGTVPKRIDLRDRDTFPASGNLAEVIYYARMINRMPEEIADLYASGYRTERKRLIIKSINERSGRDVMRFLGLPTKVTDYQKEKAKEGWLNNYTKTSENIKAYKHVIEQTYWDEARNQARALIEE